MNRKRFCAQSHETHTNTMIQLTQLPTELLLMILEYLSYPNIYNMKLASSTYFRLLREDYESLTKHNGNWTFKHQSYRSWYQICLGQLPYDTSYRISNYESPIHPKLFYLHSQLDYITQAIRIEQKQIVTDEKQCEFLLKQQLQKTSQGNRDPSVVLLPVQLFQLYFWLARIQKELSIQQMMPEANNWIKQIFSARSTKKFNKHIVKDMFNWSSRTMYIIVYIPQNKNGTPDHSIQSYLKTTIQKKRKVQSFHIIQISKKLETLQRYEDKYVSMGGKVNRRQLYASIMCNEIK
jgi:hypothetical protein